MVLYKILYLSFHMPSSVCPSLLCIRESAISQSLIDLKTVGVHATAHTSSDSDQTEHFCVHRNLSLKFMQIFAYHQGTFA